MGSICLTAFEHHARCCLLVPYSCWLCIGHTELGINAADASNSDRIGVIRDAFTPFNASEAQLSKIVASLSEGQAAVNSAAALAPQGIVIDEYTRDDENQVFRLTHIATDLLR